MTETNNKFQISKELHPNGEKSFDNEIPTIIGNQKRIHKKCLGCCDFFTCYQSKNYDYCQNCSLNGSRYLNKDSPCSECDGSGWIKFKGQPTRSCKLCYLANKSILDQAKHQLPEFEKNLEQIKEARKQLQSHE